MRPALSQHSNLPPAPAVRCVQIHFDTSVAMDEVQATLELARLAVEALYGPEHLELDGSWDMDLAARTVAIDTSTSIGRTLAIIFLGFVKREFGSDALHIVGFRPVLIQKQQSEVGS
jgi:hypothetical protein